MNKFHGSARGDETPQRVILASFEKINLVG
jgi:hypothetical protein